MMKMYLSERKTPQRERKKKKHGKNVLERETNAMVVCAGRSVCYFLGLWCVVLIMVQLEACVEILFTLFRKKNILFSSTAFFFSLIAFPDTAIRLLKILEANFTQFLRVIHKKYNKNRQFYLTIKHPTSYFFHGLNHKQICLKIAYHMMEWK